MTRKSIHLTERTENLILERSLDQSPNWSGTVNHAFEMLAHLSASEKPDLHENDWVELYNVYAGSDLSRIALPINIASDLLTHYGATIPSQFPEQAQPLAETLVNLSQAQQFAVIDAVRLFWAAA